MMPKNEGPMSMPAKIYPVTLGNLKIFTTLARKSPARRIKER